MEKTGSRQSENEIFRKVIKYGEIMELLIDGPLHKQELSNLLSVSESTIYRRTKDLENHSLIENKSEGYCLTNFGEIYVNWYQNVQSDAQRLYENREILNICDRHIPYWMFKKSTVTKSKKVCSRLSRERD